MHPHSPHEHQLPSGRSLYLSLGLTLGFALVEAVAGWWAGSLALLGDAGHMVTDATALGLAAFAAWLTHHPASLRHSYGYARAEVLAAFINSILMMAVVFGIVSAAIQRLQQPQAVNGETVIVVAIIGLVVNALVAWLLSRGEQSLNIRAALLHVMGDLLGSVAALSAGVIIYFTGWLPIDPLLSLVICALIMYSAFRLLRETIHVLMEGVPLYLNLSEVGQAMAKVPGVIAVHDLHIWTLASNKIALSAHITLRDFSTWEATLHQLRHLLHERFEIEHITLQPERDRHVVYLRDLQP